MDAVDRIPTPLADARRRRNAVIACALTYPLVWGGAGLVAAIAATSADGGGDTGGLGAALFGFAVGVLACSVLWAIAVFLGTRRFGRAVRAACAAVGVPAVVIVALWTELALGVVLALALPAAACWWATSPVR